MASYSSWSVQTATISASATPASAACISMLRKSVSNARSISEHGKISAAAPIPASWHTAISVSRLIRTDTPQMSVAETGQTSSVRALPRRNTTRHTRQRNVCRPFRFHFVIFLRERTRDTYRSRQRGNFCPGLPFPERFLISPKEAAIAVRSTAPPVPKLGGVSFRPRDRSAVGHPSAPRPGRRLAIGSTDARCRPNFRKRSRRG